MRIDSSGRVGIGTSSPTESLAIHSSANAQIRLQPSATGTSGFINTTSGSTKGMVQYNHNSDYMRIYTNGSERLRITSSGNVGIGTSSPDTLLEVVGADPILTIRDTETSGASSNATLRLAESGASDTLNNYWDINHTGGSALRFVSKIGATTAERMRIDSSGNLLVGTTAQYGQGLSLNGKRYCIL